VSRLYAAGRLLAGEEMRSRNPRSALIPYLALGLFVS
jgi:hypothetical protein